MRKEEYQDEVEAAFEFRGKPVHNRVAQVVIAASVVGFSLITLPAWLSANYVLKKCGRKGFIRRQPNGKIKVKLNFDAFEKE